MTEISGLDITQGKCVEKEMNKIEEKRVEDESSRNANIYQIAKEREAQGSLGKASKRVWRKKTGKGLPKRRVWPVVQKSSMVKWDKDWQVSLGLSNRERIGNVCKKGVTRIIGSEATLPWIKKCMGVEEVELVSRNLMTNEKENMIVRWGLQAQLARVLNHIP